jgi:pimeloyl-ACP methyl ester carboxylesterase
VIPLARLEVVSGCTFRVLSSVADPTDAVTFVLVHGIGVSHRYLARLHRELARTSTVHSIDLPGFGGLPKPPVTLGVTALSTALATLLERIGVTRPVLVGHSMGTQWVVELALQRPTLSSHVVLIGPVSDDRHRTALAQSIALAMDTLGEPIDGNALVFADYLRCGPRWYLRQLREMLDYPLEERVRGVAAPLLIVRGGRDPIAGLAWARRLRDNAGSASLVVVPGHQHLVQHTAPRTVTRAIAAFLEGVLPR